MWRRRVAAGRGARCPTPQRNGRRAGGVVTIVDDSLATAAELLRDRIGDHVRADVALAQLTTYRVGGAAALFVDARSLDDLMAVAQVRRATGVAVLVVGRGSNMLVADTGFDGVALSIAGFADVIDLPEPPGTPGDACCVTAGGGVSMPVVA